MMNFLKNIDLIAAGMTVLPGMLAFCLVAATFYAVVTDKWPRFLIGASVTTFLMTVAFIENVAASSTERSVQLNASSLFDNPITTIIVAIIVFALGKFFIAMMEDSATIKGSIFFAFLVLLALAFLSSLAEDARNERITKVVAEEIAKEKANSQESSDESTEIHSTIQSSEESKDPFDGVFWSNGAELTCVSNDLDTTELIRPLEVDGDDDTWWRSTSYVLELSLPEPVFVDDSTNRVRVYYPSEVEKGERGVIIVRLLTGDAIPYQAEYEFVAKDDLQLIYGDEDPEVASGGEIDTADEGDRFRVAFWTSASDAYLKTRNPYISQSGICGSLRVEFRRYDSLSELADS